MVSAASRTPARHVRIRFQRRAKPGRAYTQQNNAFRGNIAYRTGAGVSLGGDWTGVEGNVVEGNVLVADTPIKDDSTGLTASSQLQVRNNRFYANGTLPTADWVGQGNSLRSYADAATAEGWSDPDRTLKRYVLEVLNLTLLDWSDDPMLDADEVAKRVAAGEIYDPAGLKTFMAIATGRLLAVLDVVARYAGDPPMSFADDLRRKV